MRTVIPQTQEVRGGCSKLRNDGIHNLYSWPNIRGWTNKGEWDSRSA